MDTIEVTKIKLVRTGFNGNGTIYLNDGQIEIHPVKGNRHEAMTIAKMLEATPELWDKFGGLLEALRGSSVALEQRLELFEIMNKAIG